MTEQTGKCMCGNVRFTARDMPSEYGVCHCEMCRRWTGSALLGVSVPEGNVTWTGEDHISRLQSSDWAERAWCKTCGTGLWFKVTMESKWSGNYEIPLGLFDQANGFTMNSEIYIDHKPDSFAYAGEGRTVMTRQQCVEMFGVLDSDGETSK
ncbi:MAG: GFA family protein [Halocynthiibacter sp.]